MRNLRKRRLVALLTLLIKQTVDFPRYKELTGVPGSDRSENIEFVFREPGGK